MVPQSLTTVEENSVVSTIIVTAVANPTDNNHVRVGAIVKAVHVELWYLSSAAQPTFQVSTVEKLVGGSGSATSGQMSDLNTYPNKKNIFETSQGLVGDSNSNPMPVFKHWIKIPKGKQRMGLGDAIVINVAARGEANNDVEICGMYIYKEYY